MFDPQKLTQKSQETLARAIGKAQELKHATLEDTHLLWALVSTDGVAKELVGNLAKNFDTIIKELDDKLSQLPQISDVNQPKISGPVVKILDDASDEAKKRGDSVELL